MKFTISITRDWFRDPNTKEIGTLEKIGFTFVKDKDGYYKAEPSTITLEINTLQQLVDMVREFGRVVIDRYNTIEIYNDYRE